MRTSTPSSKIISNKMIKLLVVFAFVIVSARGNDVKFEYEGFKVYRVKPATKEQNDFLIKLQRVRNDFDFWVDPNPLRIPVDVMVAPKNQRSFVHLMQSNGMIPELFIKDIQSKILNETVKDYARSGMTWNSYYKLEDINSWLESLAIQYPNNVKIISAGKSYEGRDIKGIKITFNKGKRGVFIEGGIHAREWISPATVTYIINELLTTTNPAFKKIATNFDWYLFPSVNPDGYVYSHTKYRLWRKTRTPYTRWCAGADPNRNWDFHWNEKGSSPNTCHQTYAGPHAFSEPETASLSKYIESIGSTLDVYLAFHSYSQMLLMPYGHTSDHLDNYDDVLKIGKAAAKAILYRYGTEYKVGNIAEIIYEASGGSMDWVKHKFKVPIAFTYELRDTGRDAFILPSEQIIPNCEEVIDSMVAMFKESARLKLISID